MPNLKAAKKDLRQSGRRAARNLRARKDLKVSIKQFRSVAASDTKKAQDMLPDVFKKLDKAAKTNLIASNKAARLKSRLSKKLTADKA
ncbi:MAG: 30S ribosomal protein S20 [Candidatus Harrisonbacteria bacterium]|nr:30S ribosomal protein S20 [Candidatus Harrisonbacteria bacterium]